MRSRLLLLLFAFCGLARSGLAQADSYPSPTATICEVIAAGLTAALRTSSGLHIVQAAELPSVYFDQLSPKGQSQLLARVQGELEAPDSLLQRSLAQRGAPLPPCNHRLEGTVWLQQPPEALGDTSVITLSLPVLSEGSDEALVYVGWSNRWAGRGDFYLFRRAHEGWSVVRTASAWVQ